MEASEGFVERKRWLFLGLPFTFTKYTIKEDVLTIDKGLLRTVEDDCYMYKIVDVTHSATLLEKIFKLGTIICYTGDTTHKTLEISHIKHSKEVKQYILEKSEEARLKRRTINTLDIGNADMEIIDEIN